MSKRVNIEKILQEKFTYCKTLQEYLLEHLEKNYREYITETSEGHTMQYSRRGVVENAVKAFKTRKPIVYVVGNNDYVKIGQTTQLDKRIPTVINQFPFEYVWLFKLTTKYSEKEMHMMFDVYKTRNEFFRNDGKLREFIMQGDFV